MSKRGVGRVLVLTFAVALAAATAFQDFRLDTAAAEERAAADAFNRSSHTAQMALANLRGAQASYVAIGQDPAFWLKRAGELAAQLETSLAELQSGAKSPEAKSHYDAAISSLGVLNSLDQRAREDLSNGEGAVAAGVVFADANTAVERLSTDLTAGHWAEAGAHNARIADLRRLRLGTTGAGLAALLVMVVVVAIRRRSQIAVVADPAPMTDPASMLPLAAARPPAQAAPDAPRIDLTEAAQICVDLARVLDGQDVPPLLKRAADVLDARGLVLWVVDPAGAFLRPSLTHGYSDRVLQRLGPLQTSADNVTSLAFRSLQAQSLGGQATGASSAIAVPLITPSGCIGVLSAEVSQDRSSSDALSLARIFAAQLATLVSPNDAAGEQQVAQG